jgi:hypothetical protein
MIGRPDPAEVLSGLKDFQRKTAEYVFDRFYGLEPTRRFLVADEVGLGKTLVARGVIAQAIDFLWDTVKRIDIVYICSNADIARQNIQRLKIPGYSASVLASRLTLLPLQVKELSSQKVNFIAFTPGTSFEQTAGGGVMWERLMIYWLLDQAWGIAGQAAPLYVLRDYVGPDRFRYEIDKFDRTKIDAELSGQFVKALAKEPSLRARFDELCACFCRVDAAVSQDDKKRRSRWLSDIRRFLAKVCLRAVEPDLIILDEFQRFKHLLSTDSPAGELANDLFDYTAGGSSARVLLLSATPYKMLSLHHEVDDDHYSDFLTTLKFLDADGGEDFTSLLAEYRDALAQLGTNVGMERMRNAKIALERRLRRVIARTERLSLSSDPGGMLLEKVDSSAPLLTKDVSGFLGLQKLANALSEGDLVEYWKSAPFLFNFMDAYQLKQALNDHPGESDLAKEVLRIVRSHPDAFLDLGLIRRYREIPAGNPRLRSLLADTVDRGAWKLLWVPPTLPYYEATGSYAEPGCHDFTKRLVFSGWHVVPKTVAAVLSYEAERRMVAPPGKPVWNTAEARKRRRGLLRFAWSDGRLTGLPLIALVYPCVTLARDCDPRSLARDFGERPTAAQVITKGTERIRKLLEQLPTNSTPGGAADERWYWVAPIILDLTHQGKETTEWWQRESLAQIWSGAELDAEDDRWADHVREAWSVAQAVTEGNEKLGARPSDLAHVLALVGVGGPAVTALRAFARSENTGDPFAEIGVRDAAAKTGRAFLPLFNHPEVRELLRSLCDEEPYWLRVLEYAVSGNIQAMLDEYAHVLRESLGLASDPTSEAATKISEEMAGTVSLRAAVLRIDDIAAPDYARRIEIKSEPMRIRFAMRFGDERGQDESGTETSTRKERVRSAFNSPFWPFVLATTSVGQEGLDFHPYCHAVVHWNLPSNPVDLEQREGRIHRYKGHAIRKNVAASHGQEAIRSLNGDPWDEAFESARINRAATDSDLVPYWLFPGNAKIERHVPCLPFSRELGRLSELRRALAIYRLVFGQSRQEDLIEYLLTKIPAGERDRIIAELRIDLSPATTVENHRATQ